MTFLLVLATTQTGGFRLAFKAAASRNFLPSRLLRAMVAMVWGFKNIYSRKYHRQRGGGVRRKTLRIKRRKKRRRSSGVGIEARPP